MLVAMLLTPTAITLFGVTQVIVVGAAVYLTVAVIGLVRFAGWRDADPEPVGKPEPVAIS
jgi:hypothetical protein